MTCLTPTTPHSLGFILISLVITSQFLLLIFAHLPPTFCALEAPRTQFLDLPGFDLFSLQQQNSSTLLVLTAVWGFPGDSNGKESAFNSGDPDSLPGLWKSPGERNGNPLQYSWLENSMDRGAWQATVHGVAKSRTQLSDFHFGLTTSKYVSSPHFSLLNSKFIFLTSYLTSLKHLKYVQIFLTFSNLASLAILPHVGR